MGNLNLRWSRTNFEGKDRWKYLAFRQLKILQKPGTEDKGLMEGQPMLATFVHTAIAGITSIPMQNCEEKADGF